MFLLNSSIFFWDLAILMVLVLCASICIGSFVWLRRFRSDGSKGTLVSIVFLFFLLCLITVSYGSFVEPQIIVTTRGTVIHPNAPPVKMVVVSDFHVGPYKGAGFTERVVQRINALVPDIVLLPGDFVYTPEAKLSDLAPLADIHAPLGVFAVLGNHDTGHYKTLFGKRYSSKSRGDEIAGYLEQLNITVLRNIHQTISVLEGDFTIAGIDDLWTGDADLGTALENIDSKTFTILLSHNPSVIDEKEAEDAHLIVSGHTHGGQIRLPGIGPLVRLPTSIGQQYDQGVFDMENGRTLVITRGVGESSGRSRFFAWPEVLVLEIES